MITTEINPPAIDDEYLSFLNLSYGVWGDQQQYDWYFRRPTAFGNPDLIVVRVNGRMAAGTGVSYRIVTLPNDKDITVGIVTGAWTLPQYRGQGLFARVMLDAVQLTKERAGALLLGFVKQQNASARQMERLGSALFPGFYLAAPAERLTMSRDSPRLYPIEPTEHLISELLRRFQLSGSKHCRFSYPTKGDFIAQYLNRPGPTEILTDGNHNFAIVEERGDLDILQLAVVDTQSEEDLTAFMSAALASSCGRLLSYSTSAVMVRVCQGLGFDIQRGYIATLVADEHSMNGLAGVKLEFRSKAVADPTAPYYIGPWLVNSGDRL